MKRWAVITVALYGLLLVALTIPVGLTAAFTYSKEAGWHLEGSVKDLVEVFGHWGYWLWLFVLLAAQGLLLLVPVRLAERRPLSRRRLVVPVVTASFLLANVLFAGVFAVLVGIWGDKASVVVEAPAAQATEFAKRIPPLFNLLQSTGLPTTLGTEEFFSITTVLGFLLALWLAWAFVFYHYAQTDQPDGLIRRATHWLIRASILELLVAVPSHILVRHRNDCCAPIASFWGIVTGISVMLLAFGPGVYFLFVRRIRQRQPKPAPTIDASEADR